MARKRINKFLNIFQTAEAIIAAIILVILILPRVIGFEKYVVLTGSMEPVIKPGTLVYVDKHTQPSDISAGDIIAFYLDDDYIVTHRVVEVHNEYFVTKGDANEKPDEKYVYNSMVLGKVKISVPYVGYITPAFKGTQAYVTVGIVILINLIIALYLSLSEKKEKETTGELTPDPQT